jgi:NADH-quinone oxidoreductase subunit H
LKFALFFLAEYINMATVAALATTLFLGGWHAPFWIDRLYGGFNEGYWPVLWFLGKLLAFIFMFIWLRGSLPRMRYDQFMALGWKYLIPISLGWIVAVGTIRAISLDQDGIDQRTLLIIIAVAAVVFLGLFLFGDSSDDSPVEAEEKPAGFPVPPMPTGGAVRGSAAPLTFETNKIEAGS